MQFKVGDRVRLDNLKDYGGSTYDHSASNTVGNIGTIVEVFRWKRVRYFVNWDNKTSNGYFEWNLRYMEIVNV